MTLVKWKPARNIDGFANFESMLNDLFIRPHHRVRRSVTGSDIMPNIDVLNNEKEYRFQVEVPGMDKKDLEITFKEDILTLKGEKKAEKEENQENYLSREISYGKFERSFRLTEPVNDSKISANYKSGILTISIPKEEVPEKATKKIEVK